MASTAVCVLSLGLVADAGLAGIAKGAATGSGYSPLSAAWSGAGGSANLRVGSETLRRCTGSPAAYCGTVQVPLDWQATTGPTISVCFRWYPATGKGAPEGTVLPVEGGPGYPSIGSVAPDGYRAMYGPVLRHFNLLAVDLRGTGCSTVLDCPKLQDYAAESGGRALAVVVGQCADELNHRWKAPGGGYVHASDLFTTAPSAEDVAAVIRALGVHKVDLYGDSYGSWFAQVFASRFPSLIRSVTLDSTYPVLALDPWYRITIATMPGDFDAVCARSQQCAAAGGVSWPRMEALAARLSAAPVSGDVPGPNGTLRHVTMGIVGLVNLVSDSAEDPEIYRGLDAAARALLADDEVAPLLRLYAQRLAFDESYFGLPVDDYSVELYMAVSCLDYPQLFPMSASEAQRVADLAAAERTLPPGTFSPFTTAEWLAMDQNTENYTACLDWPRPVVSQQPVTSPPPLLPSGMPVLILGGELDTWTPPAGVPEVQAEIGGDERFVEFANETHVVGDADPYGCASSIIRDFVTDPAALSSLHTSCAAAVPSIRAVGSYPDQLSAVRPVVPSAGSGGVPTVTLRLAAAAVMTAGDAVSRFEAIGLDTDDGLYGGRVTTRGSILTLAGDQLVPAVPVGGDVTVSGSGELTMVTVSLHVSSAWHGDVRVSAIWDLYGGTARAVVLIESGGRSISGTMPAP